MADKEQLAILKKGVKVWNEWRSKNLKIVPNLRRTSLRRADLRRVDFNIADLRGANLYGATLSRANLSRANLGGAMLSWANLPKANLHGAYLHGADLRGADLRGADLRAADLGWAELYGANLSGANLLGAILCVARLEWANLSGADLRGADLSGAYLGSNILADVDLSKVKGLEEVSHLGPSYVSTDTIYKSNGKIPEVFLRGCGVPDEMIDFVRGIMGKAIEFYSCFISYSSKDDNFAKRVHADLQSKGVRVWFAPKDLKIGDPFPTKIDEAIRVYDKLMLVLSKHSINSAWVRKEVQTALEKEKREKRAILFPIRLDDAFLDTTEDWADDIRRNRHVGDFKHWKDHDRYQTAFEQLLRDLKAGSVTPG